MSDRENASDDEDVVQEPSSPILQRHSGGKDTYNKLKKIISEMSSNDDKDMEKKVRENQPIVSVEKLSQTMKVEAEEKIGPEDSSRKSQDISDKPVDANASFNMFEDYDEDFTGFERKDDSPDSDDFDGFVNTNVVETVTSNTAKESSIEHKEDIEKVFPNNEISDAAASNLVRDLLTQQSLHVQNEDQNDTVESDNDFDIDYTAYASQPIKKETEESDSTDNPDSSAKTTKGRPPLKVSDVFTDSEGNSSSIDTSASSEGKKKKLMKKSRGRRGSSDSKVDLELLSQAFDRGWKREVVLRGTVSDNSSHSKADVYYYAPTGGKKLRSIVEIQKYLTENSIHDLTTANFNFSRNGLGFAPNNEIVRQAKSSNTTPFVKRKLTDMEAASGGGKSSPNRRISLPMKKRKIVTPVEEPVAPIPPKPATPVEKVKATEGKKKKPAKKSSGSQDVTAAKDLMDDSGECYNNPRIMALLKKVNCGVTVPQYPLYDAGSENASAWNQSLCRIGRPLRLVNTPSSHIVLPPPAPWGKNLPRQFLHNRIITPLVKGAEAERTYHCTARCTGVKDAVPSLHCLKCRCLFHPQCVHLPYSLLTLVINQTYKFMCPNCYLEMKAANKNVKVPKFPVIPYEPLSYPDYDASTDGADGEDEGMGSDLENFDPDDPNLLRASLAPASPTTPNYSLDSYFPPSNVSDEDQRNLALMALQNNTPTSGSTNVLKNYRKDNMFSKRISSQNRKIAPKPSIQPQMNKQQYHQLQNNTPFQSNLQQSAQTPMGPFSQGILPQLQSQLLRGQIQPGLLPGQIPPGLLSGQIPPGLLPGQIPPGMLPGLVHQLLENMKEPEISNQNSVPMPMKLPKVEAPETVLQTVNRQNYFGDISEGYRVSRLVLKYLPVRDLITAAKVSVMWRDLAHSPHMWQCVQLLDHSQLVISDWNKFALFLSTKNTQTMYLSGTFLKPQPVITKVKKTVRKIVQKQVPRVSKPPQTNESEEKERIVEHDKLTEKEVFNPMLVETVPDSESADVVDAPESSSVETEVHQESVNPKPDLEKDADVANSKNIILLNEIETSPSIKNNSKSPLTKPVSSIFDESNDSDETGENATESPDKIATDMNEKCGYDTLLRDLESPSRDETDSDDDGKSSDGNEEQEQIEKIVTVAKMVSGAMSGEGEKYKKLIEKDSGEFNESRTALDKVASENILDLEKVDCLEIGLKEKNEKDAVDEKTIGADLPQKLGILDIQSTNQIADTSNMPTDFKSLTSDIKIIDHSSPKIKNTLEVGKSLLKSPTVPKPLSTPVIKISIKSLMAEAARGSVLSESDESDTEMEVMEETSTLETSANIKQEDPNKVTKTYENEELKSNVLDPSRNKKRKLESCFSSDEEEIPKMKIFKPDFTAEHPTPLVEPTNVAFKSEEVKALPTTGDVDLTSFAEDLLLLSEAAGLSARQDTDNIPEDTDMVQEDTKMIQMDTENKVQEDTEKVQEDTEKIQEDTEKIQEDIEKAHENTKKVQEDTEKVQEDTEKVQEDTEKVQEDTEKVQEDTEKVQEDSEKVQEDSEKVQEDTEKVQEDTEKVQEDTKNVQGDIRMVQEDTEKIEVDTEKVQKDAEKVQEGSKMVQKDTDKVQEEMEKAQKDSEKAQEDADKVQEDADKVQEDADKVQEDAEKVQEDAEKVQEDTDKVQEDAEKVQEDAEKIKEDTDKVQEDAEKVQEDAEKVQEDTDKVQENAEKVQEDADKVQEDADKVQEDADKVQEDADKVQEDADKVQEDADKVQEDTDKVQENSVKVHADKVLDNSSSVADTSVFLAERDHSELSDNLQQIEEIKDTESCSQSLKSTITTDETKIEEGKTPMSEDTTIGSSILETEAKNSKSFIDNLNEKPSQNIKEIDDKKVETSESIVTESVSEQVENLDSQIESVKITEKATSPIKMENTISKIVEDEEPDTVNTGFEFMDSETAESEITKVKDMDTEVSESSSNVNRKETDISSVKPKSDLVEEAKFEDRTEEENVASETAKPPMVVAEEVVDTDDKNMEVDEEDDLDPMICEPDVVMDVDDSDIPEETTESANPVSESKDSVAQKEIEMDIIEEEEEFEIEEEVSSCIGKEEHWKYVFQNISRVHLQKIVLVNIEEGVLEEMLNVCHSLRTIHVSQLGGKGKLVSFNPNYLLQAPNLQDLHLSGNFTFSAHFNFIKLSNLKRLGLLGAQLSRWPYISTDISHLYLSPLNAFTADNWDNIGCIRGLRELYLGNLPTDHTGITWYSAVSQLSQLRKLSMVDVIVTHKFPLLIKKLYRLRSLAVMPKYNDCDNLAEQFHRVRLLTPHCLKLQLLLTKPHILMDYFPHTLRKEDYIEIASSASSNKSAESSKSRMLLSQLRSKFPLQAKGNSYFTFKVVEEPSTLQYPQEFLF